jgi:predicted DNA-binding protein YlxM (UPF0122 family)
MSKSINKKVSSIEANIESYKIYKNLLTDTQREYFEKYYLCDLTLQEIAQEHGISRSAVLDSIKKTNV